MNRFQRWHELTAQVDGYFSDEAAATWDVLLDVQETRFLGALGEIGVYHGRSAALLALHTRDQEHLSLVDLDERPDRTRFLRDLLKGNQFFFSVDRSSHLSGMPGPGGLHRFRWFHIDGDHTGEALVNDLRLASEALQDEGIVCLDDFFSPMYPQLTAATFHYLAAHPHELVLFLCGFNKGYLCRPTAAARYQHVIRSGLITELSKRGISNVTVFKTTSSADMACFGMGPKWKDYDYYGWDADPSELPL